MTAFKAITAEMNNIPLPSILSDYITTPINISRRKFALATALATLKIFDSITKTWTDLDYWEVKRISHEKGFNDFYVTCQTLSYDKINNKCYIYSKELLLQIDMNKSDENLKLYKSPFGDVGMHLASVFHDEKLHIIGARDYGHIIFDTKTTEWIKHMHHEFVNIVPGALVHVKSKNVLYLMGGYDYDHWEHLDKIWKYSFDVQKWECLFIKLPVGDVGLPYFLTMDERYIVVTLTKRDNNREQVVFYLDLEKEPLMFIQSPFKPKFEAEYAIMTGEIEMSRKIVYGYKRLFVEEMFISLDVIEMILTFYAEELVHFFIRDEEEDCIYKHLMVSIKDIIPSYG